jgi:hypothetical protein
MFRVESRSGVDLDKYRRALLGKPYLHAYKTFQLQDVKGSTEGFFKLFPGFFAEPGGTAKNQAIQETGILLDTTALVVLHLFGKGGKIHLQGRQHLHGASPLKHSHRKFPAGNVFFYQNGLPETVPLFPGHLHGSLPVLLEGRGLHADAGTFPGGFYEKGGLQGGRAFPEHSSLKEYSPGNPDSRSSKYRLGHCLVETEGMGKGGRPYSGASIGVDDARQVGLEIVAPSSDGYGENPICLPDLLRKLRAEGFPDYPELSGKGPGYEGRGLAPSFLDMAVLVVYYKNLFHPIRSL